MMDWSNIADAVDQVEEAVVETDEEEVANS
jgi:hypothetical protein